MHWRKGIHLKVSAAVAKTNSETFSSSADASLVNEEENAECSHGSGWWLGGRKLEVVQDAMT